MRLAEPLAASWKASLALGFTHRHGRSVLSQREHEGPLVVQKALYPEGESVCHAIVVHPPGGIAGGDELELKCAVGAGAHALLTTPGAAKWYRTAGPWAKQRLRFEVDGMLEWLPRETIVFDGARAELACSVELGEDARFIGWEILCLGRTGSGERFDRGQLNLETRITRRQKPLWVERGSLEGGGRLMHSPAGLGGRTVFGTFAATSLDALGQARSAVPDCVALTQLPGLLVGRYLGDSSEEALRLFTRLWQVLRPGAVEPRIWRT